MGNAESVGGPQAQYRSRGLDPAASAGRLRGDSVVSVPEVVGEKGHISMAVAGRYSNSSSLADDFDFNSKVLGSGLNGPVRLATHKESKRKFAVKSFTKNSLTGAKRAELKNEVEIYLALDHPYVARLEFVYEEASDVHLVMELMEGGELYDRLSALKQYSEDVAATTIWQILLSVTYLHERSIVHRDLKLENFLYEKPGEDHLKLIDFGFAKHWSHGTRMSQACGSLHYVAPEVLRKSYTDKADLWSVGVVSYMLLTGRPPFGGTDDEVLQRIKAGDVQWSRHFAKLSAGAQAFVKSLLVVDPAARMSAADALNDKWIQERHAHSEMQIDLDSVTSLRKFAHATQFRRASLSMMAWSLTGEQQKVLREEFMSIDKDNSGTITLKEFKDVLQRRFHIDAHECESLFERADVDHDHLIQYSEFLAATLQTRVGFHEDLVRAAFHRFDADESGVITADDLQKVIGNTFEGQDVRELVAEADVNKDGHIDYNEFIDYIHAMESVPTPKGAWRQGVAMSLIDASVGSASSPHKSTHAMRPNISGHWEMIDDKKQMFKYDWVHTGSDRFSGQEAGAETCRGTIQGNRIEWLVAEVRCEAILSADGKRITDGQYFNKAGEKLGIFTGENKS